MSPTEKSTFLMQNLLLGQHASQASLSGLLEAWEAVWPRVLN